MDQFSHLWDSHGPPGGPSCLSSLSSSWKTICSKSMTWSLDYPQSNTCFVAAQTAENDNSQARSSETLLGHNLTFAITLHSGKFLKGEWECLSSDAISFQEDILLFFHSSGSKPIDTNCFLYVLIGRSCFSGCAVHYWVGCDSS